MNGSSAILSLAAAVALGVSLSACGRVGPLEQPAPLYGERAKADYAAKKAAAEARDQERRDQDQIESLPRGKRYDPNMDTTPARALPIPGGPNDPNGAAPPGSLPDPYNRPR